MTNKKDEIRAPARGAFSTTRWTLVAQAARTHSPEGEAAMEELSVRYWYPLYAFARRKGLGPEDAEDMTQEFFAKQIVTRRVFKNTDQTQGKFRSWLLACLQNFLANQWARQRAQKRGGEAVHLALDFCDGERRYLAEPAHELTPERLYNRAWASTQIDRALEELERSYRDREGGGLFDELRRFLPGACDPQPHAVVAERVGKSEAAIKMAVSRLRREFGQTLRTIVSRTVSSAAELDEEIRELIDSLSIAD